MRMLSKYFFRGVFTLLPFGLTVVLLFSFLKWSEQISAEFLSRILGSLHFPGLGLLIGISFICFLGYLTTLPFMRKVFPIIELPFKNVPIVKSVYSAVKSLADYFSPESEHSDQQVVIVKLPNFEAEIVGLITRQKLDDLPAQFSKDDRVAVYLPLSYQVGGLTIFIPRSYVKRVDLRVEVAMRSALTAWMPSAKD